MTAAAPPRPAVVAVHMGYGHLRAGLALAEAAGTGLLSMDRAPFASPHDVAVWDRLRTTYERLSRRTGLPLVGPAYRRVLEVVTAIPRLRPPDAQREPSLSVRYMATLLGKGFGGPLVEHLKATGAPLVSTFYAAAIVAEAAGVRNVVSVITDADVNRVWAPADAAAGTTTYAVPTARAARRLRAFGVPAARIHRTGFPLPRALVGADGAEARRRALAARLVRLDPRGAFAATAPDDARALRAAADARDVARPLEVAFAVGGAGAQVEARAAARRRARAAAARGDGAPHPGRGDPRGHGGDAPARPRAGGPRVGGRGRGRGVVRRHVRGVRGAVPRAAGGPRRVVDEAERDHLLRPGGGSRSR